MDTLTFVLTLIALGLGYLWITARCSKSESRSDYFLAGRKLGPITLGLSIMATQLGGGTLLGASEEAYNNGWGAILWPLGAAVGLLALGLGLGRRMRRLGVSTVAELYAKVYGKTSLQWIASSLSIGSLFLLLTSQMIASRQFLGPVPLTLTWLVVIAYTVMGGLKTVVMTDVLQTLFIGAILFVSFGFAESPSVSFAIGEMGGGLKTLFVMPLLFMVIGQDMGQRCFAAKDEKSVSRAFYLAAAGLAIIGVLPVTLGIMAKGLGSDLQGAEILLATISSPVIKALLACTVIVAIVSTADSMISAVSSNLSQDFGRVKLGTSQVITLVVGIGAMGLSFGCTGVAGMQILSYELSVDCLAVSILAALFVPKGNPRAAILSIAAGAAGFVLLREYALLLSAAGYGTGLAFGRRRVVA